MTSPVKLVGKIRAIALGSKPPLVTRIARTGLGTRLQQRIIFQGRSRNFSVRSSRNILKGKTPQNGALNLNGCSTFFFLPRNCSVYVTELFSYRHFLFATSEAPRNFRKIKCLPEEHVLNSRELGETCPLCSRRNKYLYNHFYYCGILILRSGQSFLSCFTSHAFIFPLASQ